MRESLPIYSSRDSDSQEIDIISFREQLSNLDRDVFKSITPILAHIIDILEEKRKDDSREKTKEYFYDQKSLKRTENITFELETLSRYNDKTVTLLQELLDVVKGFVGLRSTSPAAGPGGTTPTATGGNAPQAMNRTGITASGGLAAAGAAGVGMVAGATLGGTTTNIRRTSVTAVSTQVPPEGRALLDAIASGEASVHGYNAINFVAARTAGHRFESFEQHPFQGQSGYTAAGRYQFLWNTYEPYMRRLGLTDFSPESQDRAAWALAQDRYTRNTRRNLEEDLKDPQMHPAITQALAPTWHALRGAGGQRFMNVLGQRIEQTGSEPQNQIQDMNATQTSAPPVTPPMTPSVQSPTAVNTQAPSALRTSNIIPYNDTTAPTQETAAVNAQPNVILPARSAAADMVPAVETGIVSPQTITPASGMQVMQASQENAVAERTPSPPAVAPSMSTPAGEASPGTSVPTTQQSATDPGRVEPEDAAERYARMFNMAA